MRTSQNNIEKSLHSLAFLIGIELKRGWKTELAKWFGVPLSLLSNWINRNALPKERMKYIEDCEYSREQWYIEEEIQEGLALGDQASAEVIRGGVIVPEDNHEPEKEGEDQDMWKPGITKETLEKFPVLKHLLQYAADGDEEGFTSCIQHECKKTCELLGEITGEVMNRGY